MKRLFVFVLFACTAWAQIPATPAGGPNVSLIAADPVTVARGKTATATLLFKVNEGFHINSNKPNSELLIPTALHFSAPTDIMLSKTTYPAGEQVSFPFSEEKLSVYSGEFKVTSLVRPLASARPGTYRVHGELKYQACNNRQCFPPKSAPIAFDVKIAKPAAKAKGNPAQSPHIKP